MLWLTARLAPRLPSVRTVARTLKGPVIRWRVEDQAVIAELPGQILPEGISGIEWSVFGLGKPVKPSACRHGGNGRISESEIEASLPPASGYRMTVRGSGAAGRTWSWGFDIPDITLALFHPDGTLLDPEAPDPFAPGQYLALVKGTVPALLGVAFDGPASSKPMLWFGWSGWHITVGPGATVGGHRFGSKLKRNWSLSPPITELTWLVGAKVHLGAFPLLRLETPRRCPPASGPRRRCRRCGRTCRRIG